MADTALPRDEFPVAQRYAYLDHAGTAPLSRAAAQATTELVEAVVAGGGPAYDPYVERVDEVRAAAARLLGARPDDLAFVKNTTEGLGHVATGLDLGPGDRVVVPDREFPSTIFPWLALERRGVEIDRVQPLGDAGTLPLDAYAEVLERGGARVVTCSWVQFQTGWRTDLAGLAQLCHDHGALLCVDLIQGLGAIPVDVAACDVDFAVAGSHKWMLGPMGCGVLYVAPDRLEHLVVHHPGWNSVGHREEWENLELVLDEATRRFEGGTLDLAAVAGLGASLDLLERTGIESIWAHVEELCRTATVRLTEIGATIVSDRSVDGRSGILTFTVDGRSGEELCEHLRAADVICAPRAGGVRLSPHGYNTVDDIERLVERVAELAPAAEPAATESRSVSQGPMRRPDDW
ncbi:MAG: aminotransferase class V-fold PLP-dependent enzyme [Acidimicrobiia bacterium]|nr:aminotransferase class V-fold PLP-dependent enzyme [Acidimicrobiia bacterium]